MNSQSIPPGSLDLSAFIRPGDHVVCGQAGAEPRVLTAALTAQRARFAGAEVFVGALFSDTFRPAHADLLKFASYGALGSAAPLARSAALAIVPTHYSELPAAFRSGRLPADVVLLQLAPALPGRRMSLGLANDYTLEAARRARVVIAEVNRQVPWTHGAEMPAALRIDAIVEVDQPPLPIPSSAAGETERAIGRRVAELVPDGATIETGIGMLPDAVLEALSGHRDLGFHSGMAGDRVAELIEAGVITNSRKTLDAGLTVANIVCGTPRVHRLAHDNPVFVVREQQYTHGAEVLARHERLFAINAALEVDLTGQVNSEWLGGTWRGGVGGVNDFARAARRSPGGRSIIVLPSTAGNGAASRIVASVAGGSVTVTRSDADLVVTEWGVADLRDCSLAERARRMIAIAAPQHREALAAATI